MNRTRKAKIIATLGPSSSDAATVRALFDAGADVFRLNFSHGSHDDHRARIDAIRALEKQAGRPIAVLADLQGPKLRLGTFAAGPIELAAGDHFRLDLDPAAGDRSRAPMPHPEIFAALTPGADLLLDDGRVRLRVEECGPDFANTTVVTAARLSDRKGVNVPGAVLPLSAMTEKDRRDLAFALDHGADWIALSFVQRPDDIADSINPKLTGAQPFVDDDMAALYLYSGAIQAEVLDIPDNADRQDHALDDHLERLAADLDPGDDIVLALIQRFDRGAGVDLDPLLFEALAGKGGDLLILDRQHPV